MSTPYRALTHVRSIPPAHMQNRAPRPISERYLSVQEICQEVGIGKSTVYRLIDRKELKAVRIGRVIRVLGSSWREYKRNNLTFDPAP